MSYEVLARKYRPQTFEDVVGQDHVTRTLANAITQKRLAHAYLFVGPRGIGKTSTARILAKALNCAKGPTVHPCGECVPCREIASGNSLDVLEIDGASNNGVEQVRELRENVRFAPARGRFKVYIIDEVHMLSTQAFNALLKTLEEPPPHAKFIFATTEAHKVLPTILSRCQRFDLRRIPSSLIARHLLDIAGREKITLPPEAADAIARAADGGLRDAESMLDQLAAFCGNTIGLEDVLAVFGLPGAQTIASITEAILRQDIPAALATLSQQDDAGRDLMRLLSDLIAHLRNVLVTRANPRADTAPADDGGIEQVWRAQAQLTTAERLLELIEIFSATEERMRWAPNKRLHLEIATIKAIQSLGETSLTEILDTLATSLGQPADSPPARPAASPRPARPAPPPPSRPSPSAPAPAAAPPPPAGDPTPLAPPPQPQLSPAEFPYWQEFIDLVEQRVARLARRILQPGTPLGVEGNHLVVAIPATARALLQKGEDAILNESLRAASKRNLTVRFVTRDEPEPPEPEPDPPQISEPDPAPAPRETEDAAIEAALDVFKAKIVKEEPTPREARRPERR